MKEKDYIDQHLQNTCNVIIQHIKNIMLFQDNIKKPWGYHSRFIERLVHPEDELIFKGYSKPVFQNLPVGTIPARKEHIVPMSYLINSLWELMETQSLSDEDLSIILKRNLGIAYISHEEQKKLDSRQYGLKTKMPEGWCLRNGDPLDRLKVTGIELLDEFGQPILSLI
ncbi:hypothetical protein ACFODO_11435 [Acinetobacter sichuanensis]|uniref:Uncharacterized protein n=1 Tax=Acinetobacter sichuanensis TaxID=2136183 RepID=A0A371YJI6_9GAMM|nr:hypothetical protein [Acinetobacter sichuanensis]EKW5261859.1 hypothetical protein [Acinetobacter baumannii]EKW5261923.1 hypothetical protein [Acinetobacter baumannii]RFC81524.1 hypothetical protein C9E89_021415 [Acinetobacter sichuanensis]